MGEGAVIQFPHDLTVRELCKFSVDAIEYPKVDKLSFDSGASRHMTPTAMIMLIKACRARCRLYSDEQNFYLNLANHVYANNLGFSSGLNLENNPYPQGAFGGRNYFPITIMRRAALAAGALDYGDHLGDAIERECAVIARVVSQDRSDELRAIIARSFREIFRNTFEHSTHDSAVYCAQYWPYKKVVEICISDAGIGVPASLSDNRYIAAENDREAVYLSLMPGISSKAWRNKKKPAAQRSEWDNSGFGLFFAHRLFGQLGHFFIGSASAGILIEKGM